jgi:hypothetical protein
MMIFEYADVVVLIYTNYELLLLLLLLVSSQRTCKLHWRSPMPILAAASDDDVFSSSFFSIKQYIQTRK